MNTQIALHGIGIIALMLSLGFAVSLGTTVGDVEAPVFRILGQVLSLVLIGCYMMLAYFS